jgi:hypothetical protein
MLTGLYGCRSALAVGIFLALWDDIEEGPISESRREEKGIPLEKIKADLVKRGRVRE